ncbi:MAG: hypothetical protein ABSE79_24185 [Terriglobia bacterium]
MDNQTPAKQNEEQPNAGALSPDAVNQDDAEATDTSDAQQLTVVEKQMTGFEKATLRWAKTAVVLSGLAAVFVCGQWWEMRKSGADTHNLATAAGNQADWTKDLAGHMKDQADRTKDLSDRMKDQADQTKVIATQAKVSADAATSAANTAKDTLHISERAYLVLGPPKNDFPHKVVEIPIINSGHIPAGTTTVVLHWLIYKIDNPTTDSSIVMPDHILERKWSKVTYFFVPIGNEYNVEANLHAVDADQFNTGNIGVMVAATMTYNDGFPNSTSQTWVFCEVDRYSSDSKTASMRPCADPDGMVKLLTSEDGYPDTQNQEK